MKKLLPATMYGALTIASAPYGLAADARHSTLSVQALDFKQRCSDRNVVLCDPLDEGRVEGSAITSRTKNITLPDALRGSYRDWRWCHSVSKGGPKTPALDRTVKASGSGALKFTIPSRSGAGASGNCQINFTPDNSVQFGEGETFYVQFRVRMSCTLLFTDCDPSSPEYKRKRRTYRAQPGTTSFKVSIINVGDHSALEYPTRSCTPDELVLGDGGKGIVSGYHSCNWYDGHRMNLGLHKKSGWNFEDRQPVRRSRDDALKGCYNIDPSSGLPLSEPWRDCVLWEADQWMTVTQQVTIGQWADKAGDPARSSNIRIWIAREGEAPMLVIDYDRNLHRPEKPFLKYGKIWLLPYMTNKDASEVHPEAYMWFDELIVSRGPIAPAR